MRGRGGAQGASGLFEQSDERPMLLENARLTRTGLRRAGGLRPALCGGLDGLKRGWTGRRVVYDDDNAVCGQPANLGARRQRRRSGPGAGAGGDSIEAGPWLSQPVLDCKHGCMLEGVGHKFEKSL